MKSFENPNKIKTSSRIGDMLREGVQELVIHGEKRFDKEGKEVLLLKPDLDSRAAMYLIELAQIDYKQLTFVPKGSWVEGSVNIDTGEVDGLLIDENNTVFIDHHGPDRKSRADSTSATMLVYDLLWKEGLLEKEKYLDTLVDFVTDIDNADYPLNRQYFLNDWWRSLYGLHQAISFESLVNVIKSGRDPREPFTLEEQRSATIEMTNKRRQGLYKVCENQRNLVNDSVKGIEYAVKYMKQEGIRNSGSEMFGSILFNNVGVPESSDDKKPKNPNRIRLGFTAARAFGFDSYFMWNEQNDGFFISSIFDLQKAFDIVSKHFPDAKLIRGTMIIYNPEKSAPKSAISRDQLLSELGLKSDQ